MNCYVQKTAPISEKNFSIIFIQVVCAISVVTLHTNGCFWSFSATERYWFTANIVECVFYFGVPVFFMLTGITLLDYQRRYSTRIYFQKRFQKVLIPYMSWSIIGILFKLYTKRIMPEDITIRWIINGLLSTGGIIDLYWFFQPLFCVYLSIPLFASIDDEKKKETAKYLLISGFIINIFIPFLCNTILNEFNWTYNVTVISTYFVYIVGGGTYTIFHHQAL